MRTLTPGRDGVVLNRFEVAAARRGLNRRSVNANDRPDPAATMGSDRLSQIDHIVILMMENHSFDNYFGMLKGRGDAGLVVDDRGVPSAVNKAADGSMIRLRRFDGTTQKHAVPSQSWNASHIQFDDGTCAGFVRSIEQTLPGRDASVAMTYWTEEDLPFYYGLARTFPLATRWFCSCLGPTFPNRRFLIAGTANGLIDDLPFNLLDYPATGTIFDLLTRNGISWVNYHPVGGDKSRARRLAHYRRRRARRTLVALAQGLRKATDGVQKDIQFTADLFPVGIGQHMLHIHGMDQFFADADAGTLPAFSL